MLLFGLVFVLFYIRLSGLFGLLTFKTEDNDGAEKTDKNTLLRCIVNVSFWTSTDFIGVIQLHV